MSEPPRFPYPGYVPPAKYSLCQDECTKEGVVADILARLAEVERRCAEKERAIKAIETWVAESRWIVKAVEGLVKLQNKFSGAVWVVSILWAGTMAVLALFYKHD